MTTRAEIIAEARTWIGTPFEHQGRIRGEACDCVGLPIGVALALGLVPSIEPFAYGPLPVPAKMEALLDKYLDRVRRDEERPADIAWMRDPMRGGAPRHLGIIGDAGTIIHAYSSAGRVVEHIFTDDWKRKVRRYYRFRGVED